MNERTCTRCDSPLGAQAWKCPQCGQLNATGAYKAAVVLSIAAVLIFLTCTVALVTA